MKKSFLKRCIATAKALVAGDEEEEGRAEGSIEGARASSEPNSPLLSLQTMMQEAKKTFQRFTAERGLDDDANDDASTGEDD